jgi:hypothetical protein
VIGVIITLGMLYLGYKNLVKNTINIEKRVDDLGIPLVIDSRGKLLVLPDSTKVKFFARDSAEFLIKRKK